MRFVSWKDDDAWRACNLENVTGAVYYSEVDGRTTAHLIMYVNHEDEDDPIANSWEVWGDDADRIWRLIRHNIMPKR